MAKCEEVLDGNFEYTQLIFKSGILVQVYKIPGNFEKKLPENLGPRSEFGDVQLDLKCLKFPRRLSRLFKSSA